MLSCGRKTRCWISAIFKSWNWTSAILITVATTFALFGALFLVPQYLQVLRGLTPIQSGLILLPSSLVTVVALPISGILMDRFGPKMSILIGLVALGIASYLLSGLTLTTPTTLIQLWLIGRSIGLGFASQPASVIALSDVPPHEAGARIVVLHRAAAGLVGLRDLVPGDLCQRSGDTALRAPGRADHASLRRCTPT